jgi:uncharacterized protein YndB with AHSA1/START domain
MSVEFTVSDVIPATPQQVYDAWLSSEGHSGMTGAGAHTSARVGAAFDAWDGYIEGRNVELVPGKKIVQSWRTTEFKRSEPDSRIEVTLEAVRGGTRVTLRHTNVPDGGEHYEPGWRESYFEPMKEYFRGR